MLHRTPSLWVGSPKMRWGQSYPGRLVQEPGQRGATRTADWEKGALFGVKMFPWHCRMSSSCPHFAASCYGAVSRGDNQRHGEERMKRAKLPAVPPPWVPPKSPSPPAFLRPSKMFPLLQRSYLGLFVPLGWGSGGDGKAVALLFRTSFSGCVGWKDSLQGGISLERSSECSFPTSQAE